MRRPEFIPGMVFLACFSAPFYLLGLLAGYLEPIIAAALVDSVVLCLMAGFRLSMWLEDREDDRREERRLLEEKQERQLRVLEEPLSPEEDWDRRFLESHTGNQKKIG